MRNTSKRLVGGFLSVVLIVAVATLAFAFWPTHTTSIESAAGQPGDSEWIARGKYVATASDCIACHTAKGGQPFAGGLAVDSPIGAIYSTNITPDNQTGIGDYTLDDFERALRHGIRPDGVSLYPAMPYPSYARMTDEDIAAMYAYFMHDVPAVNAPNREPDIQWPLSMRWPLAIWRKVFGPNDEERRFDASKYGDERIARGAYLVQGAGHCGACHTARAVTLQEKGMDESSPYFLSGGPIVDGWLAINLRGNPADGLGNWTEADIVSTLKSGRNTHSAVAGEPMNEVVTNSLQHLTDDDLGAIAAYLKTLPGADASGAGASGGKSSSSYTPSDETTRALKAGADIGPGAALYADNCAACHRSEGKGNPHAFPALAGNPTVLSEDPTSVIRLILDGGHMASTKQAPSNLGMPGFAWRLNDREVAELATFVRNGWGNRAPAVEASQVKALRSDDERHDGKKDLAASKAGGR